MICGTFSINKIPDGEQDAVAAGFEDNKPKPTSVTKTKNTDGTWKVVAVWPPCAVGVTTKHTSGA